MVEPVTRKRSEKRQRTEQFRVRLTPAEKAELEARAETACLDVAAYVRTRTLGTKGPRTRPPRMSADLAALAKLRAEIGYVGNNLNQLTRLANMGDLDRPAELDQALKVTLQLLEQVRELMR